MRIKQRLKHIIRDKSFENFNVVISPKQYKSHIVYDMMKKEIRFNETFLKSHKNELDVVVDQVIQIITNNSERMVYHSFEV